MAIGVDWAKGKDQTVWKLVTPEQQVERIKALLKKIEEIPPNDFRRIYHGRFEALDSESEA